MPYSFRQQVNGREAFRRMPHLFPGALSLALLAGYINSVALGFFHSPVSHMTGAVSYLGIDIALDHETDATTTVIIIISFILGAVMAGVIIGARDLLPGRRFGAALVCEGTLIVIAMTLILHGDRYGPACVAWACGLQNATTSSYCGLSIRTTHVTGTVTDFGVMIGHWIRHRTIDKFKFLLMGSVVAAFGLGVWVGAVANEKHGPIVLGFAAASCFATGGFILLFPTHRWLRLS
jgi:uncharacterized membrane protein YoaK (UPF0700 family)